MARWDKNNNKMQVLDTYETPQEAFDQLMRYIPKEQKIWEPFPGSGRSGFRSGSGRLPGSRIRTPNTVPIRRNRRPGP